MITVTILHKGKRYLNVRMDMAMYYWIAMHRGYFAAGLDLFADIAAEKFVAMFKSSHYVDTRN